MIENGVRTLYLAIEKETYAMLEAGLLWYRKLRSNLEEDGFVFNEYDPCVANEKINGSQHTIRFHVDDVLSSHIDPKVSGDFVIWGQVKYCKLKDFKIHRVTKNNFLWIFLDFRKPGECGIMQFDHVMDMTCL